MLIIEFEQFEKTYKEKGYLHFGTYIRRPTKPLNPRQLETAYKQYLAKVERRRQKDKLKRSAPPSRDSVISSFIRNRDGNACRLLRILTTEEYNLWKSNYGGQDTVDAAHVFGKGAYPWMRYVKENVVCLNRFSHSCLDTQRSPLTGKLISLEEHTYWWKRIVGEVTYNQLLFLSVK